MCGWLLPFAASSAVAVGLFVMLLPMIEGFGHEVGPPRCWGCARCWTSRAGWG